MTAVRGGWEMFNPCLVMGIVFLLAGLILLLISR